MRRCSWAAAAELQLARPVLDAAGARLVVISVATPAGGRQFCAKLTPPLPEANMFCDPNREVYSALGLYKGVARTFFTKATPEAINRRGLDSIKLAATNYTMIPPPQPADSLQQGGLLVVDGGRTLYAWRDEGTGDHAPIEAVLEACRRAATA